MKVQKTKFSNAFIFTPKIFQDKRGLFLETFNKKIIFKIKNFNFVQDNLSKSKFGVLRGLHFQTKPFEQGKFVSVLQGKIFDVIVDLRKKSKSFLKWQSFILDDEKRKMLWVPPGFAHGFLTLSREAILQYKVTNYYSPENEKTLDAFDRKIAIKWPLPKNKILRSNKDENPNFFLK